MSKTRHLDTAIAILSGAGMPKRPPKKAQVEVIVEVEGSTYTIQVNGKVVESESCFSGVSVVEYATQRAEERAKRVRALGKTCTVTTY